MKEIKEIGSLVLFLCFFNVFNQIEAKQIIVDQKGNGNFVTLQEAINSIRAFDPDGSTSILLKNGKYHEKIIIPDWICNVRIIGQSRDSTIISFNDHAKIDNMGTFRTYTLQVHGNDIIFENLTVENAAEPVAQAVALHTEGDRIGFYNCRFLGNQDTIYAAGEANRLYFENCYIEGTTDFIFGGATAWFEKCVIHCKRDSYITAASTPQNIKYGFIFNKCKITLADNVKSEYLGRPWRAYAMTVFMNSELPKGIIPVGWDNWRNPQNEKTARYAEYNNYGEGSSTSQRLSWIKILSKKEAKKITPYNVLGEFYKQLKNN
ncbi:MAG: pectinesterase family protein [Paludibacteraceae bacterium]